MAILAIAIQGTFIKPRMTIVIFCRVTPDISRDVKTSLHLHSFRKPNGPKNNIKEASPFQPKNFQFLSHFASGRPPIRETSSQMDIAANNLWARTKLEVEVWLLAAGASDATLLSKRVKKRSSYSTSCACRCLCNLQIVRAKFSLVKNIETKKNMIQENKSNKNPTNYWDSAPKNISNRRMSIETACVKRNSKVCLVKRDKKWE